jgi:hypothetical protein
MRKIIHLATAVFIFSMISPVYAQKVERLNFVGGPPWGVFGIFATGIAALTLFAVVFLWQRRRAATLIPMNQPVEIAAK